MPSMGATHNCPNVEQGSLPGPNTSKRCPYVDGMCGHACADSWDGEHAYERQGGQWVWSGETKTVPFKEMG